MLKRQKRKKIFQIFSGSLILLLISGFFVFNSPSLVFSKTEDELKKELAEIEKLIAEQERELGQIVGEKKTLTNQINALKKEQSLLQNQIKSTSTKVRQIDGQLNETSLTIDETNNKINENLGRLSEIVRELNILERRSFIEVIMGTDSLSDALGEMENLNIMMKSLDEVAGEMKDLKSNLDTQIVILEDQQAQAKNLLSIQSLQESQYDVKVSAQNELLEVTAGKESEYQKILAESKLRATEIRNRLYDVAGGATTNVTFGEAVEIAKTVSSQTGVRAALLLAVLTQESNLGKNVGTCNRAGDPPEKSWRNVMHPTRDKPHFPNIINDLGLDIETTPVSCPMYRNGSRIGWGGAMGPAQFIPSTWLGYKDKVSAITGRPANPWDIRDAFLASGLLLKSNGATTEGETGEWKAAMRYFSGGTNVKYRFYGDNVLALARRYQPEIDALQQ